MFLYKKRLITAITAVCMLSFIHIHACVTTFINDTGPRIFIKEDETFIPIKKHEKRRFGNAHKHAYFDIYIPHKPIFTKLYTCQQNACDMSGNIELKFSDIKNNTGAASLFTITEYEPHTSMAQQVANEVKECSACDEE